MRWIIGLGLLLVALVVGRYFWTQPGGDVSEVRTTGFERSVEGTTIVSSQEPEATFRLDPDYTYVGGMAYVLVDRMDVEQHVFAKVRDGVTESVIAFQFESVRESVDFQYDYSSSELRTQIDGLEFFTDAEPGRTSPLAPLERRTSDGSMLRGLLRDQGVVIPQNYVWIRQVHLPTEDRRSEVIIVAMERLDEEGATRDDLLPGGALEADWPAIRDRYIDRVGEAISIEVGA